MHQLIKKGIVKMKNFSSNPGKLGKVKYILTGKGIKEKLHLTYYFLQRKETEYNKLKDEWLRLRSNEEALKGGK